MQVGYLPSIVTPVTDQPTVYTVMKSFGSVVKQLEQKHLPLFRDEFVYNTLLDIYLKTPDEFQKVIHIMGSLRMTKCVQHCIGKCIKRSRIEDALVETKQTT